MTTYLYASLCQCQAAQEVLRSDIIIDMELSLHDQQTALYNSVISWNQQNINIFIELAADPKYKECIYRMCLELTNGHNILDYARKEMPGYIKLY